jgi:hypothetical protein
LERKADWGFLLKQPRWPLYIRFFPHSPKPPESAEAARPPPLASACASTTP